MADTSPASQRVERFLALTNAEILDLRVQDAYQVGHFQQSGHIPAAEIEERLFELPKNSHPLRLVGTSEELGQAETYLSSKGYRIVAKLVWDESIMRELYARRILDLGHSAKPLWSPAPLVKTFSEKILTGEYSIHTDVPRLLDIGCGSGRDAIYLGLQGWQVDGIDYLPGALEKFANLGSRFNVKTNAIHMDMEKNLEDFEQLKQVYDLVQVLRYLHRPLLPLIRQKIKPGGYLIYQTFYKGCEAFGKPKNPRFILQPGELALAFNDFDILLDGIECLDDGRPTQLFIGQKPCS